MSVNAAFADDWIRHSVLLEQFKNGEIKRLMAFLNKEVIPSIIAKADKIANRYQQMGYSKLAIARRRRALLKQLRGMEAVVQGGTKLLSARLTGTMSTLAKSEAKWAAQTMQRRLPLRADYTMPSPQLLKSIITTKPMTGRFLKDWAKGVGATTAKNVNQAIMVGVAQGEGVETIVRRIRGTAANGFKDGVLQATRNEAAMVTRTAINHVGQHAREAVFAENKNVVERVQWLAVLDSRTSQICASLDSQTYEVNKGPRPPAHPNCRSVMIPVVKPPQGIPGIDSSKLPVGERAAMGGPVPGNMGFGSWLKRQPVPVQNQILGTGKAKLFRRGKVPIEKFSDIGGSGAVRALSLRELEAIEAKLAGGKAPKPKPRPKPVASPTPPSPTPPPPQATPTTASASPMGWTPAQSVDDAHQWALKHIADEVDLPGISLRVFNKINLEVARSMDVMGIEAKLSRLIWKPKNSRALAYVQYRRHGPLGGRHDITMAIKKGLGKATDKSLLAEQAKWVRGAEGQQGRAIKKQLNTIRQLEERIAAGDKGHLPVMLDRAKARLAEIKATKRWFSAETGDPFASVIHHEMGHVKDAQVGLSRHMRGNSSRLQGLSTPWDDALLKHNVTRIDELSVGEYATTNKAELFAEVSAWFVRGDMDHLPANIVAAYKEMMKL